MIATLPQIRSRLRPLARDTGGLALLEFAFTLPLVLVTGGYGVELSYLSLMNLRVSQYALTLADNASRVGLVGGAGVTQLRESDINDVLQGLRKMGEGINLTTNGRITLSSLENVQQQQDTARVQRIHWQRCIGVMSGAGYDSTYPQTAPYPDISDGTTVDTTSNHNNEGVPAPTGIGDAGRKVTAYQDTGVMFVEVNYRYTPLFGSMFVSPQIIHYVASFVVRDNRDFTHIYPAASTTASTCDLHTKGVGGATT